MANQFSEVSIVGLRATHFEQLYSYLIDNEFIPRKPHKLYDKRHAEIKEWLFNIIEQARDENNRIPKK